VSKDPLPVVEEAIRWYGANPQADASPAEVIVASLRTAGLLVHPAQSGPSSTHPGTPQ
jgi:hypothetical protein